MWAVSGLLVLVSMAFSGCFIDTAKEKLTNAEHKVEDFFHKHFGHTDDTNKTDKTDNTNSTLNGSLSSHATMSPSDSTANITNSTSGTVRRLAAPSLNAPGVNQCTGNRVGTYTWGQDLWKANQESIFSFVSSPIGKQWACGDIYINIADNSNPERIHNVELLLPFIKKYRLRSGNTNSIVWLTYGDLVEGSGAKMSQFVDTFFNWAKTLSSADISIIGRIGLSFDVEHIDPSFTKTALLKAQSLKASTKFPIGQLLLQHTIEGRVNPTGTDYVMKYADSALMMLYRNYMHDPTGKYHDDSNILSRMQWFLSQQCPSCLNDQYALPNYKAKITVMVEASCDTGEYCGKLSFCAFDGDTQGAFYIWNLLAEMFSKLISQNIITKAQYSRLFNTETLYAVHNWDWYRCAAPFSKSLTYPSCAAYHQAASACRAQ